MPMPAPEDNGGLLASGPPSCAKASSLLSTGGEPGPLRSDLVRRCPPEREEGGCLKVRVRNDQILTLFFTNHCKGHTRTEAGSSAVPEEPVGCERPGRGKGWLLWENKSVHVFHVESEAFVIGAQDTFEEARAVAERRVHSGLGFRTIAACFRTRKWCLRECALLFLV
ncbi:UNVERIFIED_CONTAM: hypothetical protein K2H54_016000 [Gekko kuhli]